MRQRALARSAFVLMTTLSVPALGLEPQEEKGEKKPPPPPPPPPEKNAQLPKLSRPSPQPIPVGGLPGGILLAVWRYLRS